MLACVDTMISHCLWVMHNRYLSEGAALTCTGVSECNYMCAYFLLWWHVICCFKSPLVIKEGTSIASKQTFLLHCSPFFKEQLRLSVYFASFCQSDGQFAFPFGYNFWDPSCLYSFHFKFWKRGTCLRNLQTTDGRRNQNRRGVKRSEKRHRSLCYNTVLTHLGMLYLFFIQ